MGQSLLDASPDVRQAAAYGVGVAAKAGGASYSSFCVGKPFADGNLLTFSFLHSSLLIDF